MITIKLEMVGFDRVIQRMSKSRQGLIHLNLLKLVSDCFEIVKDEAPKKSGKLVESLGVQESGAMSWDITEGVKYGPWVRKGITIPDIYPPYKHGTKKAMFWKGLSHPVFRTRTHDNKPNPYDLRASKRFEQTLPRKIEDLGVIIRMSMEE